MKFHRSSNHIVAVVTHQLLGRSLCVWDPQAWCVQVLKQLPFLQNASPEIFKRLLQRGQLVKYQRGEVMWQPPSGTPRSAFSHSAFACLSL